MNTQPTVEFSTQKRGTFDVHNFYSDGTIKVLPGLIALHLNHDEYRRENPVKPGGSDFAKIAAHIRVNAVLGNPKK